MSTKRNRALLLSGDAEWVALAQAAASAAGMELTVTASPEQAMVCLSGTHGMCRLLLDPDTAGRSMAALLEMTCGEAGSGVDVIAVGRAVPELQSIVAPDAAALCAALVDPDPFPYAWRGQPPLEAGQILGMMEAGSVQVRFQPIVAVRDRSLVALEVLARLHKTTCSILPPHRFIPQLEQAGLGAELLRHVTAQAFAARDRLGDGLGGALLALNLPLSVLNEPRTVEMLAGLREQAGVPAVRVLIELTESEVVRDPGALDPVVGLWRQAGYGVAIDDAGPAVPRHREMFGLPFDWVKLDKSVVQGAIGSARARRYLSETVASAHRAELSVIAEGVETRAGWEMLEELGIDCGQGFMIARPLPADVVPVWHQAWRSGGVQFPS